MMLTTTLFIVILCAFCIFNRRLSYTQIKMNPHFTIMHPGAWLNGRGSHHSTFPLRGPFGIFGNLDLHSDPVQCMSRRSLSPNMSVHSVESQSRNISTFTPQSEVDMHIQEEQPIKNQGAQQYFQGKCQKINEQRSDLMCFFCHETTHPNVSGWELV